MEGDSAFGFSGMEMETIVRLGSKINQRKISKTLLFSRYKLPIVMVVMNNNGIYGGMDEGTYEDMTGDGAAATLASPPTALKPAVRYERMMALFGLETGHLCRTAEDVRRAMAAALRDTKRPHFVNVAIDPSASRKAQSYDWLTRSKM